MACSQAEVDYCVLSVEKGLRLDGRQATDFRPLEVELSPIAQASGSARLRLGSTDVIVGVKVSAGVATGRAHRHPAQPRACCTRAFAACPQYASSSYMMPSLCPPCHWSARTCAEVDAGRVSAPRAPPSCVAGGGRVRQQVTI